MATPEGKVKAKVKALLKKYGAWYCLPVSAGYGQHGIPDFLVCHRGKFVGIETKAPGKADKVTALQKAQGRGILAAGGEWVVIADDEHLESLERWLRERG
jgi:hypothetical protein